jgi:hypothetical protein
MALLVGDNPFHGISHLCQERARTREDESTRLQHAADLVLVALENGANGFMFSVSQTTLSILKEIREKGRIGQLSLYAIVPYAFEYVRLAAQLGGITGLAKKFVKEITVSRNLSAVATGLKGIMNADPKALMETYLKYEIHRIRLAAGKKANLQSVLLHELITDMILALDLKWFFRSYIDFLSKNRITPGFNTGNFSYLVNKLNEWNIDLHEIIIAAPFNKAGFQMIPSKTACEETLTKTPCPNLIAISILAAGYLKPPEALEYIATLPNIRGVAIGVSKEKHARETFMLLKEKLCKQPFRC